MLQELRYSAPPPKLENPDSVIPVSSPVGVRLLQLVPWLDKNVELRQKDTSDFLYLIQSYSKIPEISEALYEQGYMEAQEWNETKASAMKLGKDVSENCNYRYKNIFKEYSINPR